MSKATTDVLGIGNAIVDVFSSCEEEFLESNGIILSILGLSARMGTFAQFTSALIRRCGNDFLIDS